MGSLLDDEYAPKAAQVAQDRTVKRAQVAQVRQQQEAAPLPAPTLESVAEQLAAALGGRVQKRRK